MASPSSATNSTSWVERFLSLPVKHSLHVLAHVLGSWQGNWCGLMDTNTCCQLFILVTWRMQQLSLCCAVAMTTAGGGMLRLTVSPCCSTACLFLSVVSLYVLWMEVVDVKRYVLQERGDACPQAQVSVLYGLSFMVAVAGVPLELISGLVFMLVGRALRASKWAKTTEHVTFRTGTQLHTSNM